MKKNTTAEKAILDAQKAAKAIKENTDKSLQELMNNAIAKLVMESEDEPEDEKDSYEVEDVETEEEPKVSDETPEVDADSEKEESEEKADEKEADKGEEEDHSEEVSDDENEWSDLEDFKVNDNDYDFTGLEGDELLKVFRQLGKGDKLVITKNDDGSVSVEDSEGDAVDVDKLEPVSDEEPAAVADDEDKDIDADDFSVDDEFSSEDVEEKPEEEKSEEEHIDLNEDDELGYTDDYQKDVFSTKLGMEEPADAEATYSMDAGAPQGEEKPWAGEHEEPDYEKVEECGEVPEDANIEEDGSGLNTKHKMVKSRNSINRSAQNQKVVSQDGEYKGNLSESVKKIIAKAKEIQALNEEYSKAITKLKKSLMESAVSNVSLVNMVKLLSECTMTANEKTNLMERFKNVKTLKESKETYETIRRELNESTVKTAPMIEKQFTVEPKSINETVIYKTNPCIDLMERMDNLFKA